MLPLRMENPISTLNQEVDVIEKTLNATETGYDVVLCNSFVKYVEKRAAVFCGFDILCPRNILHTLDGLLHARQE